MSENEELLLHLEKTIDQLIEVSRYLSGSFNRVFSKEELAVLRTRQEELVEQMLRVEKSYHSISNEFPAGDLKRLDRKIAEFQRLSQGLLDKFSQ